jgi:catechol 2,3-dioxygenase-like lactoylglutathione lyase family enzyme
MTGGRTTSGGMTGGAAGRAAQPAWPAGDRFGLMLADAAFIGFIPVADLATARAFYEGTLGLRVMEDTPFALVLDAGGTMLRVTPVPGVAARPFTIAGWKVPDIAAAVRALAGQGVQFTRYDGMAQDDLGIWTAPSGDRVAWFTDPDGNNLSLTAFAAR